MKAEADKNDPPKKIFLVWQGHNDNDEAYFNQYDSLEDAVTSEASSATDGEVEVFEASPKLLGVFKSVAKVVKSRKK